MKPTASVSRLKHLSLTSFLRPPRTRFVVVLGDESAVAVKLIGKKVTERVYAPSSAPEMVTDLLEILRAAPDAPILVMLDTADQQFRDGETPAVGFGDSGKVLKRKLLMTFGADSFTSAIRISQPKTSSHQASNQVPNQVSNQVKERKYIFIGVTRTPAMNRWLSLLQSQGNPVTAIGLLPLEARSLIDSLQPSEATISNSEADIPKTPRQWRLILTRERASGFRQAIFQGDKLVFSRLTRDLEEGSPISAIVENIEREFTATISYLRRFSYSDSDSISLTIIASPEICDAIDSDRLRIRNVHKLTVHDAASKLGLIGASEPHEAYADVLYAAHIGQKFRPGLIIRTPEMQTSQCLGFAPLLAKCGAAAMVLYALVTVGQASLQWRKETANLAEITASKSRYDAEQQEVSKKFTALPIAPSQVIPVLEVNDRLATESLPMARVLGVIAASLPPEIYVEKMAFLPSDTAKSIAEIVFANNDKNRDDSEDNPADAFIPYKVILNIAMQTSPDANRQEIADLVTATVQKLSDSLPDHVVKLERAPYSSTTQGDISGELRLDLVKTTLATPAIITSEISLERIHTPSKDSSKNSEHDSETTSPVSEEESQ